MSPIAIVGLEWLGSLALFLGFILLIRYLDHRERMAMIDRGLLPPERLAAGRKGTAILRGGLITGSVGIAVTIGLYTLGYLLPAPFSAVPGRLGPWLLPGLIPLGVGAALVASHYLAPVPSAASDERATEHTTAAEEAESSHAEARTAGERAADAGSLDVGVALGRIIPWRLFKRSGPFAATDEPVSDDDERAGGQDSLRRHG